MLSYRFEASPAVLNEVKECAICLKKLSDTVDNGLSFAIFDFQDAPEGDVEFVKFLEDSTERLP